MSARLFLLIGGPEDGELREVAAPGRSVLIVAAAAHPDAGAFSTIVYHPHKIRAGRNVYRVALADKPIAGQTDLPMASLLLLGLSPEALDRVREVLR